MRDDDFFLSYRRKKKYDMYIGPIRDRFAIMKMKRNYIYEVKRSMAQL